MTDKNDKLKHLDTFINSAFTTGDDSGYKSYLKERMKEYTQSIRDEGKSKTQLFTEGFLREFIDGSQIQLKGDNIVVNGKVVARLINDLEDLDNDMYLLFPPSPGHPEGIKVPVETPNQAYEYIRNRFLKTGQE